MSVLFSQVAFILERLEDSISQKNWDKKKNLASHSYFVIVCNPSSLRSLSVYSKKVDFSKVILSP